MDSVLEKRQSTKDIQEGPALYRGSLRDLLQVSQELTYYINPIQGDTAQYSDLDALRNKQKARITEKLKKGVAPFDVTGIASRIYPIPHEKGQKEDKEITLARQAQNERFQKEDQRRSEDKKRIELINRFIKDAYQFISSAFSEFQKNNTHLESIRSRFHELVPSEKSEFIEVAQQGIQLLHSVSMRKTELFACLMFMQDQKIGHVVLTADQLTDYFQGSQNHSLACRNLRYDISFDPARDKEISALLEETESMEDDFRTFLDKQLQILRPHEDETTRTRPTAELKRELIFLAKRIMGHSQEDSSILQEALKERYNYLEKVLKDRKKSIA